ncbi:MAG: SRPBCC domain-containing protein [Gammaproteobacteria bacterium]|nr:SRPBCC domain-containing protein [Gammaproteobacteria bacterium]
MADMLHEIIINSAASKVYDAITSESGLKSWWTADATTQAKQGSVATFGFGGRATVFRMRIEQLEKDKIVHWHCLGDADEWEGTDLKFHIESTGQNQSVLHFTHTHWRSTEGWFAMCNTTWGAVIVRLKEFAEGKSSQPYFDGLAQ